MIEHAYVQHPVFVTRDQCEHKFDDDGRVGFCGRPRSEHMDAEHGLRVQLATALKERDDARALAKAEAREREMAVFACADWSDRFAPVCEERDALRAEIADWLAVEAECGAVDCHCGCHVHAKELAALASGGDRG